MCSCLKCLGCVIFFFEIPFKCRMRNESRANEELLKSAFRCQESWFNASHYSSRCKYSPYSFRCMEKRLHIHIYEIYSPFTWIFHCCVMEFVNGQEMRHGKYLHALWSLSKHVHHIAIATNIYSKMPTESIVLGLRVSFFRLLGCRQKSNVDSHTCFLLFFLLWQPYNMFHIISKAVNGFKRRRMNDDLKMNMTIKWKNKCTSCQVLIYQRSQERWGGGGDLLRKFRLQSCRYLELQKIDILTPANLYENVRNEQ